jgi:hypothetical protein
MSRRFAINLAAFFCGFFLFILAGRAWSYCGTATLAEATAQCQSLVSNSGWKASCGSSAYCLTYNAPSYVVEITGSNGCAQDFCFTPPPDPCVPQAGTQQDLEFFVGFTTGPQPGALVAGTPIFPPSQVSYGSCLWSSGAATKCYSYASNISKAFCTFTYTNTGVSTSQPQTGNGAPNTACPTGQQIGYVNGQGGCYLSGTTTAPSTVPVAGTAPLSGVTATGPVAPTSDPNANPLTASSGGGGVSSSTGIAQLQAQQQTNAKLDALIAKPGGTDFPTDYDRETTQQAIKAGQCGGTGEPKCQIDTTFTSPGSGTMPTHAGSWYTSKYPSGLHGVWDTRTAALMASPLGAAIHNMAVPVGSGSEPSWSFTLWGGMGTHTLSLPSWIWAAVKAIMLLSAAFVCRRIIFGG